MSARQMELLNEVGDVVFGSEQDFGQLRAPRTQIASPWLQPVQERAVISPLGQSCETSISLSHRCTHIRALTLQRPHISVPTWCDVFIFAQK